MIENGESNDKQVIYIIDKEGKIHSVPEKYGEENHFEPYIRLDKLLNEIFKITTHDCLSNIPNRVAKKGFINICPEDIFDPFNTFLIVFPLQRTEKQLLALKKLYNVLEEVKDEILFKKKPNIDNEDLEFSFSEDEEGLENLKAFVCEELKRIRENSKKNEGR